jgi:DNA-binding LacI/PurR family transcriptional regulator
LLYNTAPAGQFSWAVDDHAAGVKVADVFFENNHKHTGFLGLDFLSSDRARQRFEGFSQGCANHKMTPPALLEVGDDEDDLTPQLDAFLKRHPDITGIFASNDYRALAAIRSARQLSINVPRDMSIVGFDGIKVGQMIDPTLATIVTAPRKLGAGASQTILSMITGSSPPQLPLKEQTFSFRAGGSLMPLAAESKDGEKVAAFPPSDDQTYKKAKIQQERST